MEEDKRTMLVMVDLANTLHPNIIMTGDCPSDHDDKRVPMLDLAIFREDQVHNIKLAGSVEEVRIEQVCYSFYKKPMSSRYILRASTALPDRMKYENATNELIRRVNNTYRGITKYKEEKMKVVNEFMVTMKMSGYKEGFRKQVALSAYRGVARMEEVERTGGRKVYRYQTEGAGARHNAKIGAKTNWFKGKKKEVKETEHGGREPGERGKNAKSGNEDRTKKKTETGQKRDEREVEGVIFIPYTTGGKLRSRVQNKDDKLTRVMRMPRMRYIEDPGRTIADTLVEKDPWYRLGGGCERPNCPVCYWSKGKGVRCSKEGVCYSLECQVCEEEEKRALYIGETSRSGRERIQEHMWLFSHKKESCHEDCTKWHKCSKNGSTLWEHSKEKHEGRLKKEDWKVTITSSHRTALGRQVTEAVRISNEGLDSLLNSKNEFGANALSEVAVKQGNYLLGGGKGGGKRKAESEDGGAEDRTTTAGNAVRRKKTVVKSTLIRTDVKKEGETEEEKIKESNASTGGGEEQLAQAFKRMKLRIEEEEGQTERTQPAAMKVETVTEAAVEATTPSVTTTTGGARGAERE